jgi:hypothetical protein
LRVDAGCATPCGSEDVYRVRAFETTYSVPRFNNAGSQVTVLLIQNPGPATVNGHAWLWRDASASPIDVPFTVPPHVTYVFNTSTVAAGVSGAVTVTHDGGYGALSGKTVALEPSTGFSFDSPMVPRPR